MFTMCKCEWMRLLCIELFVIFYLHLSLCWFVKVSFIMFWWHFPVYFAIVQSMCYNKLIKYFVCKTKQTELLLSSHPSPNHFLLSQPTSECTTECVLLLLDSFLLVASHAKHELWEKSMKSIHNLESGITSSAVSPLFCRKKKFTLKKLTLRLKLTLESH